MSLSLNFCLLVFFLFCCLCELYETGEMTIIKKGEKGSMSEREDEKARYILHVDSIIKRRDY